MYDNHYWKQQITWEMVASSSKPVVTPVKDAKKVNRKKKAEHFHSYIFKVLRQVHPEIGITKKAIVIMNSFVLDVFDKLASEASRLCKITKKDTLSAREVRTSVRLVVPGELSRHSVEEGLKAVANFTDAGLKKATGKGKR